MHVVAHVHFKVSIIAFAFVVYKTFCTLNVMCLSVMVRALFSLVEGGMVIPV